MGIVMQIVKGNHHLIRSEPEVMNVEFDFCPLLVVIYGEIEVQDKKICKGEFYEHVENNEGNPEETIRIKVKYVKSTTMVVINKEIFNFRLSKASLAIYKESLIERFLPTKRLKLTKT